MKLNAYRNTGDSGHPATKRGWYSSAGKGVSAAGVLTCFRYHPPVCPPEAEPGQPPEPHRSWSPFGKATCQIKATFVMATHLIIKQSPSSFAQRPPSDDVTWAALQAATKRSKSCVMADVCTMLSSIIIHCFTTMS